MIPTALDSNVMIAAMLSWHERHAIAARFVGQLAEKRGAVVIPAPALVEVYSVMTRLPTPHRLRPVDAIALLRENFYRLTSLGSVRAKDIWSVLGSLARQGLGGGIVYDAHILACAKAGGAKRFATFNLRDFERLSDSSIEILAPH